MRIRIKFYRIWLRSIAGLGAFAGAEAKAAAAWILTAFKAGYRHIDTAYMYKTEWAVGEAFRQSGLPREEVFVTTKLPLIILAECKSQLTNR